MYILQAGLEGWSSLSLAYLKSCYAQASILGSQWAIVAVAMTGDQIQTFISLCMCQDGLDETMKPMHGMSLIRVLSIFKHKLNTICWDEIEWPGWSREADAWDVANKGPLVFKHKLIAIQWDENGLNEAMKLLHGMSLIRVHRLLTQTKHNSM